MRKTTSFVNSPRSPTVGMDPRVREAVRSQIARERAVRGPGVAALIWSEDAFCSPPARECDTRWEALHLSKQSLPG
jgi:hypothetical protein